LKIVIENKKLTLNDIRKVISYGGSFFRGLRNQEIQIEESIFDNFVDQIDSLDPYITAMLIELSRKTSFNQGKWIKKFLEIFPTISKPIQLTPSVYCLINSTWWVPW
jgi:hypothetical protein